MQNNNEFSLYYILFLIFCIKCTISFPEQGKWSLSVNQASQYIGITKSMFNLTQINAKVKCYPMNDEPMKVKISWVLRKTPCWKEYLVYSQENELFYESLFDEPQRPLRHTSGEYYLPYVLTPSPYITECDDKIVLPEIDGHKMLKVSLPEDNVEDTGSLTPREEIGGIRVRRQVPDNLTVVTYSPTNFNQQNVSSTSPKPVTFTSSSFLSSPFNQSNVSSTSIKSVVTSSSSNFLSSSIFNGQNESSTSAEPIAFSSSTLGGTSMNTDSSLHLTVDPVSDDTTGSTLSPLKSAASGTTASSFGDVSSLALPSILGSARTKHPIVTVYSDGVYLFMMKISPVRSNDSFNATIDVDMYSSYGYLSASDYPLLVFYSIMCVVYAIYGAVWLLLCFMRWKDLLRLQYWIAAVILLGLIEKAAFVAEYESLNERGYSLRGVLIIAELISCAKRTVARILVLIVALGFGIVKPRLGTMLHRVMGLGMTYFVLASVESTTRALRPKTDPSRQSLLALVPLALLDSLICWWVFSALVTTTRTLRLRRNPTKLSVYSHFTNVLAAAVIASIAFMFWSIKFHQYEECLQDWKQLWVDIAFWHFLFALLLLAIMLLWRPTNNNQRFAFSPLLDEESEGEGEEGEHLIGGALGADTKHRGRSGSEDLTSPRSSHTAEDDLKWVEDNIPSSLADATLPVLDSDEEIMTTRFEISKMQ